MGYNESPTGNTICGGYSTCRGDNSLLRETCKSFARNAGMLPSILRAILSDKLPVRDNFHTGGVTGGRHVSIQGRENHGDNISIVSRALVMAF